MLAGFLKVCYSNLFILWAGNRDPKGRKQSRPQSQGQQAGVLLLGQGSFLNPTFFSLSPQVPELLPSSSEPTEKGSPEGGTHQHSPHAHFPVTYWESETATFAPQEAGVRSPFQSTPLELQDPLLRGG